MGEIYRVKRMSTTSWSSHFYIVQKSNDTVVK